MGVTPVVSAVAARRLFLAAQGLLAKAGGPAATAAGLRQVIDGLGFVQLDSINTVARAHDLILRTRLPGYTPALLDQLLYKERFLFEHWTHDASAIPTTAYAHWKGRFARDAVRLRGQSWWCHLLGADAERTVAHVRERITKEGPLRSADFEHPEKRGAFWGWKPQKAALDYLWRIGELAVRDRVHFNKVYDLAERVFPAAHRQSAPTGKAHLKWAGESAAERLVVFTPRELAQFYGSIEPAAAKTFCAAATRSGSLVQVMVEHADGSPPQAGFAVADWESRLRHLTADAKEPPMQLLAPFDPVIRDRARCLRRFGFDYRFEAFTPEPRRIYGYYVLPILQGDQLVGRLSPKLHRDRGVLAISGVWWEPGVKATAARQRQLAAAVADLATFVGAARVEGL